MDGTGGSGIDRRTIIKRAAVGGALVWTAPVILDTWRPPPVPSRARAPASGCRFNPRDDPNCQLTSAAVASLCSPTSPECSTETNLGPGVAIGDVCMRALTCLPNQTATFQLLTTETSCLDDDGATCPPPRRFLAVTARYATVTGAQACFQGAIQGDLALFGRPANFDHWLFWQFLIGCTCS